MTRTELDARARAFMAQRPDLEAMSLDEFLTAHAADLTDDERAKGEEILELFPEFGGEEVEEDEFPDIEVLIVALTAAEKALATAQENVGDAPDSAYAEALRLVRECLARG